MARNLRVLLAIAAVSLATGCGLFRSSSPAPKPATPIDVEIVAAHRLNPDEQGQALPTMVHIYQLTSATKLEGADFERLYRNAKETLGGELLRSEEVTLSPGETLKRRVERDPAAKFIAVVPLFRRPAGSTWRAVTELPPPNAKSVNAKFLVEGYSIEGR
jgi:type VI secretion system protein VasD